MNIYRSSEVQEVEAFYGELLFGFKTDITVHQYLKSLTKRLWIGIKEQNPAVKHEIRNYHPAYIEGDGEIFFKNKLKKKDTRLTIAREHGFRKWKELKKTGKQKFDTKFEIAVEHILNGEIQSLENLLIEDSRLTSKQSKFGHKATLLHYTASNGVELCRQRVPENLTDITRLLLKYGADKSVKMNAYGTQFDTLALLESSAHPFDAGIGDEMLKILS